MAEQTISDELIARYRRVGVPTVYTGVSNLGYALCFMTGIKSFNPGEKLVARARTLRFIPTRPDIASERPRTEHSPEFVAMGSCGPGDVLVAGALGIVDAAIGGDMILLHLKMVGAEGVVTDGGIRDIDVVRGYGYKVFAGGATPASRAPYFVGYDENVDVPCGGITVRPGDLIVADDNGIVCVPQQHAEEVIDWAEEHEGLEEQIKEMILRDNVPPGKYYNAETFDRVKKARDGG